MLRHFAVVALALFPAVVLAGEVRIGMDGMGMYPKQCHVARFLGPKEAAAAYEKRQKERFEKVDVDHAAALAQSVSVSVIMAAPKERRWCYSAGRPEKIVLATKDQAEPVLVIPLEITESTLKNLMGATFSRYDGTAQVPIADVEKLSGKEYDFHLIFAEGKPFNDTWKKDYAAKILK